MTLEAFYHSIRTPVVPQNISHYCGTIATWGGKLLAMSIMVWLGYQLKMGWGALCVSGVDELDCSYIQDTNGQMQRTPVHCRHF